MIFDANNTWKIGRNVTRIFDANGLTYDKVTSVNTETGEIEKYLCDDDGKVQVIAGVPVKERLVAPLPVTVLFEEQ